MRITLIAFLVFTITKIYAQDFEDLKVPTVPAATAFGYEQSNIEKPSTPRILTTQLQSAFIGGSIKPGIAIEVAPFWLVKKKDYDLNAYLSDTKKIRLFARSLAISFATSQTDSFLLGTLKTGTGLSFGLRLSLKQGKLDQTAQQTIAENKSEREFKMAKFIGAVYSLTYIEVQTNNKSYDYDQYVTYVGDIIKADKLFYVVNGLDDEKFLKQTFEFLKVNFFDKNSNLLDKNSIPIFKDVLTNTTTGLVANLEILNRLAVSAKKISEALASERVGFKADLSAVIVNVLQENKWQQTAFAKGSVWLTLSYTGLIKNNKGKLDALMVIRGGFNNKKVDAYQTLDIGIKLAYQYKRFNLSGEFIPRLKLASKTDWTYRATANAEYQINDYIGVSLIFGRTFDGTTVTYDVKEGSLFSCVGLNFGLAALSKK